jgi:pimeloyl-ACP methyl ester carboxylesterase
MHSFQNVDGRRLETVLIHPQRSERPCIVFLHEGLGSVSMWKEFPQAVCDAANCRGLIYSRLGYGRSDLLENPRAVNYMHAEAIDVLPEILAQLDISQPVLFGHSDGASIALIHAAMYPDRVAGVIALAPHIFVEQLSIDSIVAARGIYQSTDLKQKLRRYHDDPDSAFRGWNDIWLDPDFRTWNIRSLLPGISVPILAIQGEQDEYGTMAQIDELAQAASAAGIVQLLKLQQCGHSPQKDQPRAVIEAAAGFIAKLQVKMTNDNDT